MKILQFIAIGASLLFMVGCKSSNKTIDTVDAGVPAKVVTPVLGGARPVSMMPKVKIYKTNGDYDYLVPITLDASRTKVVSFPAPSDLTEASMPLKLDDGFLLDRRGIGMNTAFTRYTYKEYMALPQAPSVKELLDAVIPDARVTEVVEMPFTMATDDIVKRCNEQIQKMSQSPNQLTLTPNI